jgi:hypothetical protein
LGGVTIYTEGGHAEDAAIIDSAATPCLILHQNTFKLLSCINPSYLTDNRVMFTDTAIKEEIQ